MRLTATLYNLNCTGLAEQLAARGYVQAQVLELKALVEAQYGPREPESASVLWLSFGLNCLLLVVVLARNCGRLARF